MTAHKEGRVEHLSDLKGDTPHEHSLLVRNRWVSGVEEAVVDAGSASKKLISLKQDTA